MKPLGRRYYQDKTGGKHHIKVKGKYHAWWTDTCCPSRKRARRDAKKEIEQEVNNENA